MLFLFPTDSAFYSITREKTALFIDFPLRNENLKDKMVAVKSGRKQYKKKTSRGVRRKMY